jgi:hypothetical protein
MATNYPVNPRVRAYGKARIDFAQRAKSPDDWDRLWVQPANAFPFSWGGSWKHSVEYKVDDFAAEVGFFIDILGLTVNIFDPGYAMFTSPQGDFFFSVVPAAGLGASTPPDSLRLQFMVSAITTLSRELEMRGIAFDQPPEPVQPGSSLMVGSFRTPHGICIDLFGMDEDTSNYASDSIPQDHDNNSRSTLDNASENFLGNVGGRPGEAELPHGEETRGLIQPCDGFPVYEDEAAAQMGDLEEFSPVPDTAGEDTFDLFDFLDDTKLEEAEGDGYDPE